MPFELKYAFKKNNKVIIKHTHDGTLRIQPKKRSNACGKGSNGKFAQWQVVLAGDDKIRLKSCKSGKYLRIKKGKQIDVSGGTGKATLFKVEFIEKPNIVKLESNRFEGCFIAVKPDQTVKVGGGGAHCKLTFFRKGKAKKNEDDESEEVESSEDEEESELPADSESEESSDDSQEGFVKIPEPPKPKPLDDDAKAVKEWLTTIGQEQYVDTFLENGYDGMSTVSMITQEDLDKMGVKPGHVKDISAAARAAPFLNHWVSLRCQYKGRYVGCDDGNKKYVETDDEAEKEDTWWFVEQSPNGNNLIRLRSKFDSYLRMPNDLDKHMKTVKKEKDIDERVDLQILPSTDSKKQNVVRIWNPKSANFMTYDDNMIKDRVNSKEESLDKDWVDKQKWELIIKD